MYIVHHFFFVFFAFPRGALTVHHAQDIFPRGALTVRHAQDIFPGGALTVHHAQDIFPRGALTALKGSKTVFLILY